MSPIERNGIEKKRYGNVLLDLSSSRFDVAKIQEVSAAVSSPAECINDVINKSGMYDKSFIYTSRAFLLKWQFLQLFFSVFLFFNLFLFFLCFCVSVLFEDLI